MKSCPLAAVGAANAGAVATTTAGKAAQYLKDCIKDSEVNFRKIINYAIATLLTIEQYFIRTVTTLLNEAKTRTPRQD